MKPIVLGALLALVLVLVPGLVAALLGAATAGLAWAVAQPPVLAFALGAVTWPRIRQRVARIPRSIR
jgi:hypothetical protein